MKAFLMANGGTILVCVVLLVMVGLAIAALLRNKRKGKTACGCSCGGCPMSGSCQSAKQAGTKKARTR